MKKNFMTVSTLGATMLLKAKDNENPEAGAQATAGQQQETANEDGIEALIDKGVSLENTADEAAAQIAKENKERRVEETKAIMLKSSYIRGKQLLVVKRDKRRGECGKDFLKDISKLDDELRAGKHDATSYEKEFKALYKKRDEKLREIDRTYSDYVDKLRNQYPTFYRSEWNYSIQ